MARANMSVNFAAKSARSVPRHSKGTAVESSSEIWRTFCESHVEATILTPDEKIWLAEIGSRKAFQEVPSVRAACGNAFDPNPWSSVPKLFS